MDIWPGRPFPLGAAWDGEGTNFSLFSENAESVELCLFDDEATRRASRSRSAPPSTGTATSPASAPASATATASTARTHPRAGHRFNPHKLLLDPYAKAIDGRGRLASGERAALRPARAGEDADLEPDDEDDAAAMPKCVVIDPGFDWEGDRPPATRRGTTRSSTRCTSRASRSAIPTCARTCAAPTPASRRSPAIAHLQSLGVTAVELLPIHQIVRRGFLVDRGLTNYWGYSSIGYLAPHAPTPRPATAASRCASSRAWSRRCTAPGSR